MKALIVVDVQNDFMPGGALPIPAGEQIVPVINKLMSRFDVIVATQDWHPLNHQSFASNHPGKKVNDSIQLRGIHQVLWPDHCVQDSWGADFHIDLETANLHAIIRKGMTVDIDSYSAFYDNGHLEKTGLAGYLRELDIKDIYFCGLAADICVYHTIQDALAEGFQCTLIEDASKALSTQQYQRIKADLVKKKVAVIQSQDL